MFKRLVLIFLALFIFSCQSKPVKTSARDFGYEGEEVTELQIIKTNWNYKKLKTLNLDDMTDIMNEKYNDYKTASSLDPLREGVMIAFSRSNEDGTLDKIISIVKSPLEDQDQWEITVQNLVNQCIAQLKKAVDPAPSAQEQVSCFLILENLIAEYKPAFVKQYETGGFETYIIHRIAQSQIEFSREAQSEIRLNLMRSGLTPSELAQKLVQQKEKKLEAERERKEKENSPLPEQ